MVSLLSFFLVVFLTFWPVSFFTMLPPRLLTFSLSITISIVIGLYLRNIYKGDFYKRSLKKKIFQTLLAAPLFIPTSTMTVYFLGFVIVGCYAPRQFWPGIDAAHKVHSQIKIYKGNNGYWPKSETQVKQLDSKNYNLVTDNAKTKYIYDSNNDNYYWFVRPSRFSVAIYTNQKDFEQYCLDIIFCLGPWPQYPPNFLGPWDKLPE